MITRIKSLLGKVFRGRNVAIPTSVSNNLAMQEAIRKRAPEVRNSSPELVAKRKWLEERRKRDEKLGI